jgi:hypothetical protein
MGGPHPKDLMLEHRRRQRVLHLGKRYLHLGKRYLHLGIGVSNHQKLGVNSQDKPTPRALRRRDEWSRCATYPYQS